MAAQPTTLGGERLLWAVEELGGYLAACLHLRWWYVVEPKPGYWKPIRCRVDRRTMQQWVKGTKLPSTTRINWIWATSKREVVTDWLRSFESLYDLTPMNIDWWETPIATEE